MRGSMDGSARRSQLEPAESLTGEELAELVSRLSRAAAFLENKELENPKTTAPDNPFLSQFSAEAGGRRR